MPALVSWLALGALPDNDAFGLVVARTTLAALMVAGLEGVVFGLLPMRFLPGETLYAWNRMGWGALLAVGAFAFFHILINPASGYLSDASRTPLLTVLGMLIGSACCRSPYGRGSDSVPNQPPRRGSLRDRSVPSTGGHPMPLTSVPARISIVRPVVQLSAVALIGFILTGCAAGEAASATPHGATASPSVAAATATAAESAASQPSSSAAAPCLRADALAALEDIANVEVDPDMPQDEVADAVEEMDLTGSDDLVQAMQDDLVALLRDGQANTFGAQVAAGVILEETGVVAC